MLKALRLLAHFICKIKQTKIPKATTLKSYDTYLPELKIKDLTGQGFIDIFVQMLMFQERKGRYKLCQTSWGSPLISAMWKHCPL